MELESFWSALREIAQADVGPEKRDWGYLVWGEVGLIEALVGPRPDGTWEYYSDVGEDFAPGKTVQFEVPRDRGPFGSGPGCRPFSEIRRTHGSHFEGTLEELLEKFRATQC